MLNMIVLVVVILLMYMKILVIKLNLMNSLKVTKVAKLAITHLETKLLIVKRINIYNINTLSIIYYLISFLFQVT